MTRKKSNIHGLSNFTGPYYGEGGDNNALKVNFVLQYINTPSGKRRVKFCYTYYNTIVNLQKSEDCEKTISRDNSHCMLSYYCTCSLPSCHVSAPKARKKCISNRYKIHFPCVLRTIFNVTIPARKEKFENNIGLP